MINAVIWLLLIELIGLLALPTSFVLLRFLPDRGYTLAKPLGLLATGYLVWLLSMLGLPFNTALCWLVLAGLFVVLNGWLFLRQNRQLWFQMREWVSRNGWLIVAAEVIFIAAYAYLTNLRSYMPDIRDQEKFGDFAFMNSLAVNTKMPPPDPWLSGYTINYYYFSHFLMAMLTKMTGIAPSIAFNLTIPLTFGLTALGAFGIVFNLVRLSRQKEGLLVPIAIGVMALIMICVLGNLDAVRQIFFPRPDHGESGLANFAFSWWTPSRVIYDYMPNLSGNVIDYQWRETINEFPMFSFLLADMHPHVMALPTVLLSIGLALNFWLIPARSEYLSWRRGEGWLLFGTAALVIGSLYFLNTWDYPTYMVVLVGAGLIRARRLRREEAGSRWWNGAFGHWAGWSLGLVVVSLILFLPFQLTFVTLLGDNEVPAPIANIPVLNTLAKTIGVVAWDRTPLLGYFLVFGVFLFPLLTYLAVKVWPYLRDPYAYLDQEPAPSVFQTSWSIWLTGVGIIMLVASVFGFLVLHLDLFISLVLGFGAMPVLVIGLATLGLETLAVYRSQRPRQLLLGVTGLFAVLITLGGYLQHMELYGPLIIAGTFAGLLLWFENRPSRLVQVVTEPEPLTDEAETELDGFITKPVTTTVIVPRDYSPQHLGDSFALWLALVPVVLTFGTELFFVRDVFESRFNSLFKFYYQAWILFGLAAAYAVWRVGAWAWRAVPFNKPSLLEETSAKPVAVVSRPIGLTPVPQLAPRLQLSGAGAGNSGGLNLAFSTGLALPVSGSLPTAADLVSDDDEAEEAEEYAVAHRATRRPWWRWFWALGLSILLVGGLVYPIFAPYEKTGHYANRVGLDGEQWIQQGLPGDYNAIKWLSAQLAASPVFYAPILEAVGDDWVDFSRVSTFTGLPTLLGWQGHEDQWRGGKAPARTDTFECWKLVNDNNLQSTFNYAPPAGQAPQQKDEPGCRRQLVETIYSTENAALAQNLLQQTGVKYVYVGSIETGVSNARSNASKTYSQAALAKFGQFMKVIYQQDGVTIYSF